MDISGEKLQLDQSKIGFRPLAEADLLLMHRWLNTPHVLEWWDKPGLTYQQVLAKYLPRIQDQTDTRCYVITHADRPIGMIQVYRIGDDNEYAPHIPAHLNAAGIDLFIGEEDYVHRGLGSHILRYFLEQLVFTGGLDLCVIGPAVSNRSAIRAYEKAGFRYLATVEIPDEEEPEYIMLIEPEK